jgi:ATP-dependent RNA helicase SUPV3L1/SUV3
VRADRAHGVIAYRDYFPRARAEPQLVLFVGPTNSGKTWHALNELVQHESGVYLAPLRLLALEGQEEIEKRGRVASFITGEERDIREGAGFIASTIEMLDTAR